MDVFQEAALLRDLGAEIGGALEVEIASKNAVKRHDPVQIRKR